MSKPSQDELEKALSINPESAKAHYNLGLIWLSQRKPELAVPAFQAALKANPKFSAARRGLKKALSQIQ